MKESVNEYHAIGIVSWGLMGDVLMRTPVLHAFRQMFPASRIVAIVDPIGKEVLKNNPDVDEIIIFDRKRKPRLKYLINKVKGYFAIKNERFNLLIDLYSGGSSANFLRLSGVSDRIGFVHSKLPKNTYTVEFKEEFLPASTIHLTKSLLKIIAPFGGDFESYSTRPIFYTQNSIDREMEHYFSSFGVERPFLLNFGSGGKEKILPMEKNFEQVKLLYTLHGYIPLIICNPGQEYLQQQFIDNYLCPANIPYVALRTLSLEEIGGMMKLIHFIITPDTGLYHIAVAIGIPIFGIFTYTDPKLVEPDQGTFVLCFEPQDELKSANIRFGRKDLNLDYLLESTNQFIKLLEEKKS